MNYTLQELKDVFHKKACNMEILNQAICDMREAMENLDPSYELSSRYYTTVNMLLSCMHREYFSEFADIGNRIINRNLGEKSNMETYYGLHLLYSGIGFVPKVVEYGLKVIDSPEKNPEILMSVYTSLAIVCKENGLTEKAIEYTLHECGMENMPEEERPLKIRLVCANNIAQIYLDNGRLEEANVYRDKLVSLMEEYPDDPEVSPLYPLIHFSILLIDIHKNNNEEIIREYVRIMDQVMQEGREPLVARQTLEPHITFLNKLLEAGYAEDVIRIARYVIDNPIRFLGNRIMLYKVMIQAYRTQHITGEPYDNLLLQYIEELERFKSEHEAVISLLIDEQYRIREVNNKYDIMRKKLEDDTLTHCFNRQSFQLNAQEYCNRNTSGCLVFMDLDHLKITNDQFGHNAGDRLLVDFVRCVNRVKTDDTMFYRYAGDEFILLTPYLPEETEEIISRINRECARLSRRAGERHRLEFSYGIAAFHECPNKIDRVVELADHRMYECKKIHRGRVRG